MLRVYKNYKLLELVFHKCVEERAAKTFPDISISPQGARDWKALNISLRSKNMELCLSLAQGEQILTLP